MSDPQHVSTGLEQARKQLHRRGATPGPRPGVPAVSDEEMAMAREDMRLRQWLQAIPSRFSECHMTDLDDKVREVLEAYVDAPAARNLVLLGPTGTGKTHAAAAVARALHAQGWELDFVPVVELLDELRPGGREGALENYASATLLLLDDLGAERPTDWTGERMYALVNRRWLEERPTLVTSNLGPDELEAAVGSRVFSRLVGNDAVVVKMTGPDRRRRRA